MKGAEYKKYSLSEKTLSDVEAQKRLDLYSKGDKQQFFSIQQIKKRYQQQIKDKDEKRSKSDIFFAQGIRSGLPHASFNTIQYSREQADQSFRNGIVEEAKSEYRRHQNLSKWFNKEDKQSGKTQTQEMIKQAEKRTRNYEQLGSLMAEYGAVSSDNTKATRKLKGIESNPAKDPVLKPEMLNKGLKSSDKSRKNLNQYFRENTLSPTKFKTMKNMGMNKEK